MAEVATFTSTDPSALTADFGGSVAWGDADGSTDIAFSIVPESYANNLFDVFAQKPNPANGAWTAMPQVTVTDAPEGGAATANATDSAISLDDDGYTTVTPVSGGGGVDLTVNGPLDLQGQNLDLGTGTVTLEDGSIVDGTLSAAAYNLQDGEVDANLAGSGAVTIANDGDVFLTGNNSYTGGTTIAGNATLGVTSASALGDPSQPITFTGSGTLQALGNVTFASTQNIVTPSDGVDVATLDTNGPAKHFPKPITGHPPRTTGNRQENVFCTAS
jgi:autotransporter-associated beta strand protein